MRRRTEGERVEQEAELLLLLLGAEAHHREDALLYVATVDTDRATADLVAVADQVVGVGQRRTRVLLEGVDPLRLGRGEGVVHRGPGASTYGDISALGGLGRRLEQRRVHDPYERPGSLVDEPAASPDLETRRTEQRTRGRHLSCSEEDAVAGGSPDALGEAGTLGIREVLGNRTAELAILLNEDVGKSLGSALLGPVLPRV